MSKIPDEIRKLSLDDRKLSETTTESRKIIDELELESYIKKGYDLQTILPSGKLLVKK